MATAVKATVRDDKRIMKAIESQLRKLRDMSITIGVHGGGVTGKDENGSSETTPDKHDDDSKKPLTMAHLAAIHEFGVGKIPERSFIRAGMDKGCGDLFRACEIGVAQIMDGEGSANKTANLIGVMGVSSCKAVIAHGIKPGLAEATIIGRLRMTKKGRKMVNAASRAMRAKIEGKGKGYARWKKATFGKRADGSHGFIAGSWSKGRKSKRHDKAIANMETAAAGSFTPLRNTGQLIQSIIYKVHKGGE